ncbi:Phosphoenolpyruvate carboxykinase, related [Trypanosoma cruzi]|nr:Phosphoenolpyruvate carboxykinase, related [Trypanosoma cruzi]
MLRGAVIGSRRGSNIVARCVGPAQQRRHVRYANIQETLRPQAGHSAGQMSLLNDICCNPDAEEERRKPIFRHEVAPRAPSPSTRTPAKNYLRTMYQWGFNSLTLFRKTNEDPGPWWNANSSTLVSNWTQVGDYANAGMWSGVWRYTYGVGEYNLRPYEVRGRAWGRRFNKAGAIVIDYYYNCGNQKEKTTPPQLLMFPHTPEHQMHRRFKNPSLPGFRDISALHGKRIFREIQYHLGQGLRFYLVDGVFGSHPETQTPYRIITDNPTHAYFASLAAIRKFNYVAQQEIMLSKRITQSPIDEWGWRRPGVLVYHAPGWDFESPRIVEEFGGPRPKDLGLEHPKFIALEPYSIPMKAAIAAEPSCDILLDVTAFLCARWGFYADDKGFLTVAAESILSPDAKKLTLVVCGSELEADILRASPYIFGARHHRIAEGWVSRAWDVVSAKKDKVDVGEHDLVEKSLGRIQKPLSGRIGLYNARSHRHYGRRHVSGFGYKLPHIYTDDAATKAAAGGHLFSSPKDAFASHPARPNAFKLSSVSIIVVGSGTNAAKVIVDGLGKKGMMYAETDKLQSAFETTLKEAKSVRVLDPGSATAELQRLAQSGSA